MHKELYTYKTLDKNGRLLKLPCKPGDTVYILDTYFWENREKCNSCDYLDIYNNKCTYEDSHKIDNVNCLCASTIVTTLPWIVQNIELFGKTVFLTENDINETIQSLKKNSTK